MNRTLIQLLRTREFDRDWEECLPEVVVRYNHTLHSQLGTSPFIHEEDVEESQLKVKRERRGCKRVTRSMALDSTEDGESSSSEDEFVGYGLRLNRDRLDSKRLEKSSETGEDSTSQFDEGLFFGLFYIPNYIFSGLFFLNNIYLVF